MRVRCCSCCGWPAIFLYLRLDGDVTIKSFLWLWVGSPPDALTWISVTCYSSERPDFLFQSVFHLLLHTLPGSDNTALITGPNAIPIFLGPHPPCCVVNIASLCWVSIFIFIYWILHCCFQSSLHFCNILSPHWIISLWHTDFLFLELPCHFHSLPNPESTV